MDILKCPKMKNWDVLMEQKIDFVCDVLQKIKTNHDGTRISNQLRKTFHCEQFISPSRNVRHYKRLFVL